MNRRVCEDIVQGTATSFGGRRDRCSAPSSMQAKCGARIPKGVTHVQGNVASRSAQDERAGGSRRRGSIASGRLRTESGIERIRFRQGGKRRLDRRNHRGRPRARRASELPERTRADQGREKHEGLRRRDRRRWCCRHPRRHHRQGSWRERRRHPEGKHRHLARQHRNGYPARQVRPCRRRGRGVEADFRA